jgi:glycopeptide antibiotics resistance protein
MYVKNAGLFIVFLIISQLLMYYFFDDLIVIFVSNQLVYIVGRLLLATSIFILYKFLRREININSKGLTISISIYLFFIILITLFKGNGDTLTYNLKPFNFISSFSEVNLEIFVIQILINIGLLIPLAILLQLRNKSFSFSLQIVLYCSLAIELIQFFTKKGSFDIDDLMLNTLGGLLGFSIMNILSKR